jgi:hypothetical protein
MLGKHPAGRKIPGRGASVTGITLGNTGHFEKCWIVHPLGGVFPRRVSTHVSKWRFRHAGRTVGRRALLSAGELDPSFGVGGVRDVDFNGFDELRGSLVLPEGGVLVVGTDNLGKVNLTRMTGAAGALDNTFGGGDGKIQTQYEWTGEGVNGRIATDAGGRIALVPSSAGQDDLFGNGGRDTLSGAGGNDRLFGGPNDPDTVNGGAGDDSAAASDEDTFKRVEQFLT